MKMILTVATCCADVLMFPLSLLTDITQCHDERSSKSVCRHVMRRRDVAMLHRNFYTLKVYSNELFLSASLYVSKRGAY